VATVLLVDDDTKFLRPLQILLEADGYRVLTAQDGEEATAVTVMATPDIVVTDWMMPRVDGVAFCRRLKADTATADIPVVMLSAAFPPSPAEQLWDVLLRKPVPIVRLIDAIASLLATRHPALPHPRGVQG
jgi:CheY-like chemotaxis protein